MVSDLQYLPLNELVELSTNKVVRRKDPNLPYIGLEHIAQDSPVILGTDMSDTSISTNSIFQSGDILFGKLRPNLRKSLQVKFNGYCSTDILVFRARAGVLPEFAARVFQREDVFEEAIRTAEGTKMPRTSWDKLKNFRVFVPFQIKEQRTIVEILDSLDEMIAHTESLIQKLKQIKAGLLHDLLTRGLDENGELRDAIAHSEQFKDSPLGLIPKDWNVITVQQAASPVPGSTTIGPFGSNLLADDYRSVGVPVVFIRDIKADEFQWNSKIYIEQRKAEQLSAHSVQPGDLLATKMGLPPCISCVYPYWMPKGIVTADIIRLRPNTQIASAEWLSLFVNSKVVVRQVRTITGGVTRPKVTLRDFRSLFVTLPHPKEQELITKAINNHDTRIRTEETYLNKLKL